MMNPEKNIEYDAPFLDDEERKLIEQAEQGGEKIKSNAKALNAKWQGAVEKTLARRPITVRLQERDINRMKRIAKRKGLPYQTLISSVIHQFVEVELKRVED